MNLLKRHFWLFLGLFFLLLFTTMPLVWTFIHTPDTSIWVPINDQYKLCGDDKVYAAMVHEQKENFFNFGNPVSKELGTYGISIFRELSMKLTLFLGLFIENMRLFFATSLVMGVLVSFSLMYAAAYALGASSFIAALSAWVTFLYFKLFSPEFDPSLFSTNILNSQGNLFFESYNDHFRYVILHSAYILFWPLVILLAKYKTTPSARWITLLSLTLIGLVYSYQPLTIIGALVLFFWLIFLYFNKEYPAIQKTFIAAGIALAVVSFFGFWGHLRLFLHSPSEALYQHFSYTPQPFLNVVKSVFLNQHTAVLLVLALLAYRRPTLKRILWSMFATVIVIKCFKFNPNYVVMIDRIFHRGFDTFWLLVSISSFLLIFEQTKIGRFLFSSKKINFLIFIALVIPNLICSQRLADELQKDSSYLIPKDQWETYDYIAKNTPKKAVFMAIDFRDNQLLPVYTSANLFFAMPFGSTIKDQFNKFLISWKYLGYDRSLLQNWMSTYLDSYSKFRCAPTHDRPSFADSFAYMTMTNIIYDPYIRFYGDIQVRETSEKFTDAFTQEVFREFDNADYGEIINNVDYILIAKDMPGPFKYNSAESDKSFKIEYENSHHILLKKTKN